MLKATLAQMPGWCSDLKYAAALGTSVWHLWRPSPQRMRALKLALAGRPLWLAASTHTGGWCWLEQQRHCVPRASCSQLMRLRLALGC